MCKPEFIIKKTDLTRNGALTTKSIQEIKRLLEDGGAVLLPSDTCYSLAVLPIDKNMRKLVNPILNREDIPISFAFPNLEKIGQYMNLNPKLITLFENFTPGCITVVCEAKEKLFADISRSQDGTIGVRLTDCEIERTVAGCTKYPITTVPPKKNNKGVQDFNIAMKIVKDGIKKMDNPIKWAAIESDKFYSEFSTVVRVKDTGQLEYIREGKIPFYSIKSVIEDN